MFGAGTPRFPVLIAAVLALPGCLASEDDRDLSATAGAAGGEMTSQRIYVTYGGHMSYVVLNYVWSPTDPLAFTIEFPEFYATAVLEMEWTPKYATNRELSLMVHEKGAVTAEGMVAEADGPSPLRLDVTPPTVPPGEWDLVAYVPMDGRTKAVVDQDFRIHATFFDGPTPGGFTAVAAPG